MFAKNILVQYKQFCLGKYKTLRQSVLKLNIVIIVFHYLASCLFKLGTQNENGCKMLPNQNGTPPLPFCTVVICLSQVGSSYAQSWKIGMESYGTIQIQQTSKSNRSKFNKHPQLSTYSSINKQIKEEMLHDALWYPNFITLESRISSYFFVYYWGLQDRFRFAEIKPSILQCSSYGRVIKKGKNMRTFVDGCIYRSYFTYFNKSQSNPTHYSNRGF